MGQLCIYYHWHDRPVAEALERLLRFQTDSVVLSSITGGIDFPASGIDRCSVVWSASWTHTVLKFWLEKLNPLVGQSRSIPVTVTELSPDVYGFVDYLKCCGAQSANGITEFALIQENGVGIRVQPCQRNEGLGRAVLGAISHRKGQTYISSLRKLEGILPWLPQLANDLQSTGG